MTLAGWGVAIPDAPVELAAALRRAEPPVVAVTQGGALVLALRPIAEDEDDILAAAVNHALDSLGRPR
ncbi:MAG: hypothetical protein U1F43_00240 [Myxococcota bacterium]